MNTSAQGKKGFTLIEVIIASLVVGIVSAATVSALYTVLQSNHNNRLLMEGTELAQSKMEELFSAGYNAAVSGSDTAASFQRTWTVAPMLSDTKSVNVVVAWTDARGYPHSINISAALVQESATTLGLDFRNIL